MSDDSPFPPSKRGTNPRSLANLKPRQKGDPNPNKTGFNGRTRAEDYAAWLEKVDDSPIVKTMQAKLGCPGATRIEAVRHRELVRALGKSEMAGRGIIEQYHGKPRQQMELSGPGGGPIETVPHERESLSDEQIWSGIMRRVQLFQELVARKTSPPVIEGIEVSAATNSEGVPIPAANAVIEVAAGVPAPVAKPTPLPAPAKPTQPTVGSVPIVRH